MKYLKMLGLATVAAMAFMAFAVSSASATTLETTGVTVNGSETITASLETGSSAVLSRTDDTLANTCSVSNVHGKTVSPFTGTRIGGPIETLTFEACTNPVTVHKPGELTVEHKTGTTDGTVISKKAEVTVVTSLGFTVNCKTGEGTTIGTLTGVKHGHATLHVNAVLNCGFLLPSAKWAGTYKITSPTGLGVSA